MRLVSKIVVVMVLLLLCSSVFAKEPTVYEKAKLISSYAKTIMTGRQNGVSIARAVEIVNTTGDGNVVLLEMVKQAYKVPHFHTEAMKNEAIEDFENKWYLTVLEILEKDK